MRSSVVGLVSGLTRAGASGRDEGGDGSFEGRSGKPTQYGQETRCSCQTDHDARRGKTEQHTESLLSQDGPSARSARAVRSGGNVTNCLQERQTEIKPRIEFPPADLSRSDSGTMGSYLRFSMAPLAQGKSTFPIGMGPSAV